jgi:hypothetical protein
MDAEVNQVKHRKHQGSFLSHFWWYLGKGQEFLWKFQYHIKNNEHERLD